MVYVVAVKAFVSTIDVLVALIIAVANRLSRSWPGS